MKTLLECLQEEGMEKLYFPPNTTLINGGEVSEHLYYVLEGELEALTISQGRQFRLFDIGPGELAGLFSFFEEESIALLSIRTITDVRLIKVSREADHTLDKHFSEYRRKLLSASLRSFRARMREFTEMHVEAQENNEKMIVQEKMATVGRLSASLAHELNNNVTVISKGLEFLHGELSRILGERFEELERQVFFEALNKGYQKTSREIRHLAETISQEAAYKNHDRRRLSTALEIQNGSDSLPLAELLKLSDEDLRNFHTLFTLGAKFRNMSSAGEQITHMVQNFKTLSRPPSKIRMEPIAQTIEHALQLLNDQLQGVEVHRDFQFQDELECRPEDLIQLWSNLISNAIDAMNGAGEITFRTLPGPDHVIIRVEDSGPGIPAEIAETIFQPHITTKESTRRLGLGLGLTICRQIVATHKGTIEAVTDTEGGCIQVILPIRRGKK